MRRYKREHERFVQEINKLRAQNRNKESHHKRFHPDEDEDLMEINSKIKQKRINEVNMQRSLHITPVKMNGSSAQDKKYHNLSNQNAYNGSSCYH